MAEQFNFQYSVPQQPGQPVVEISLDEVERMLLKRLEDERDNPVDALREMALFYGRKGDCEKSMSLLRQLLGYFDTAEKKAGCILAMGGTAEQMGDFPSAIAFYKEALSLEPANNRVWYFIHNNLGYCLNKRGQFSDGEQFCRLAIAIDPNTQNAYKNLGISMQGLGRYREAAEAFVRATQVNASDPRSAKHLEDLLAEHPELQFDFRDAMEAYRKAVEFAAAQVRGAQPVVQRGWRGLVIRANARLVWWWRGLLRKCGIKKNHVR